MNTNSQNNYQKHCLLVVVSLLAVWFIVSFGCGILFRDWLDVHAPSVGNAPFGFWMAQQGSIITFVMLLIIYGIAMSILDAKHGYSEND